MTKEEARQLRKIETNKIWYAKNRQRIAALFKERYAATPEVFKARSAKYALEHPDRIAARCSRWAAVNSERVRANVAKWTAANPDRVHANKIAWKILHPGYFIKRTLKLAEKLAGRKKPKRCDVCKKNGRRICFDHCHKSQKFRGWICVLCNLALGHAKDSPQLLCALAAYLRRPFPALSPRPRQCEACKSTVKISFDHCHKTNKFRGWLCHNCNAALGMVSDSGELLLTLAKYLEAASLDAAKPQCKSTTKE